MCKKREDEIMKFILLTMFIILLPFIVASVIWEWLSVGEE